jgi:hypothetical protein
MKHTLINCAVASDGGSIALEFKTPEKAEYWITLDNGLESPTQGKIFTTENGAQPLNLAQEKELLHLLETAQKSFDDCDHLLLDVINKIKSR